MTWIAPIALLVVAAQTPAKELPPALEEITVTARRVEENAYRLPLAINVTEARGIGAGAVQNLDSLALAHPGLAFESLWGGSLAAPLLRGLSQPSAAGDNVAVFVDDVYQAGRSAMDIDMLDLARVEIVRGPQNTLYGRSSFAGAINYVAATPSATPAGMVQVESGSDDQRGVRGMWSQRVAGSAWLARAAGSLRSAEGTWRSADGERLGGYRRGSAAVTLERRQSHPEDDQLVFKVRYNRGRFGHPASTTLDAFDFNCGSRSAGPGFWSYYCGHAGAEAVPSISPGLPDSRSRATQSSLHYSRALGVLRLHSLSSFYRSVSTSYRDFDGSSSGFWSGVCTDGVNCTGTAAATVTRFVQPDVVNAAVSNAREWTQELRLQSSPAERTQWMLGLAGSWTRLREGNSFGVDRGSLLDVEHLTSIVASDPSRAGPQSQLNRALVTDSRQQQIPQSLSISRQWSASAFGTLQRPVVDGSSVRLELRAVRESLHLDQRLAAFQVDSSQDPAAVHFTTVTPRVSIDIAKGSHWYGYASLARGARTGGINTAPGLDDHERRYEPEYNWTAELAAQYTSSSLLRHARVTLYRTDWRNAQITGLATTPGVGTLITTNTAGILARGIEMQGRLQGHAPLFMELAFSLADTGFRAGSDDAGSRALCGLAGATPVSSLCSFGPPRTGANSVAVVPYLDGNQSARAPRASWNVSLALQPIRVADNMKLAGQVALAWQDDVFERPINGLHYGQRELLSARISLDIDRWRIQLSGDNLTDAHYIRSASSRGGAFYPSSPRPVDLLYADGRRIGLTIAMDLSAPGTSAGQ